MVADGCENEKGVMMCSSIRIIDKGNMGWQEVMPRWLTIQSGLFSLAKITKIAYIVTISMFMLLTINQYVYADEIDDKITALQNELDSIPEVGLRENVLPDEAVGKYALECSPANTHYLEVYYSANSNDLYELRENTGTGFSIIVDEFINTEEGQYLKGVLYNYGEARASRAPAEKLLENDIASKRNQPFTVEGKSYNFRSIWYLKANQVRCFMRTYTEDEVFRLKKYLSITKEIKKLQREKDQKKNR